MLAPDAIWSRDAAWLDPGPARRVTTSHGHDTLLRNAACSRKLCQGLTGRVSLEAVNILEFRIAAPVICA